MNRCLLALLGVSLTGFLSGQVEVLTTVSLRATAAAVWFDPGEKITHCRATLEHGSPAWKPAYRLDGFRGQRVRFGSGAFAQLRLSAPLQLGKSTIPPGVHNLVFECAQDGTWSLVLIAENTLSRQKIRAYQPERTSGMGIAIPLSIGTAKTAAKRLQVAFENTRTGFDLAIHWGPHRLTCPVALPEARELPCSSNHR